MIALAVVLLLVAVSSLVSYMRETRKYKNTFKKSINFYPILHKRGS
ncbi:MULTISPECIES: small membrane protein [Klebsiella]